MFTFAHLSDPHLPLPRARPADLLSKRILGWQSWHRNRKRIHRPEVLSRLLADIRAVEPNHIVVTGDLGNISLPEEFANAARWLRELGPPEHVSVIPGNHDAYVAVPWTESGGLWRDYLQGDATAPEEALFPMVRLRQGVALIGLNTAVPMPWYSAGGRLGQAQLVRLEAILQSLGRDGAFRVVMLHHPPYRARGGWRKSLIDAKAFAAVIERAGAELILHGHDHRASMGQVKSSAGNVPVLGVPSASAFPDRHGYGAAWNLYGVERQGEIWRLSVIVRGVEGPGLELQTRAQFDVMLPARPLAVAA